MRFLKRHLLECRHLLVLVQTGTIDHRGIQIQKQQNQAHEERENHQHALLNPQRVHHQLHDLTERPKYKSVHLLINHLRGKYHLRYIFKDLLFKTQMTILIRKAVAHWVQINLCRQRVLEQFTWILYLILQRKTLMQSKRVTLVPVNY